LKTTIRIIGRAIKDGSVYQPIRLLAASEATKAPPKDYHKQIAAIFDAITTRWWRYVYDPQGTELVVTNGKRIFDLVLGSGKRKGFGDCDDISAAAGALLRSIGMDVRIATTAPVNSQHIFTHVFIQTKPPRSREWITFDPVVYPKHGLGYIAPHSRIALWDLDGRLIAKRGKFPPRFNQIMSLYGVDPGNNGGINPTGEIGDETMYGNTLTQQAPNYHDFDDYSDQIGFLGTTDCSSENDPRLHDTLADFQEYGIAGYGCYADVMGSTPGDEVPHIMAEYDDTDTVDNTGLVRTKHFEMSPDDYQTMQQHGQPMIGALALADDGEVYRWTYDQNSGLGFFKKLFKKARKFVKRVAGKVKRVAKKIVTKLPFGKTIWKIGSKIHRTAMKIAKPLLRVVGPIAKKIAPIAAFVPGIGPAISGALMLTGKVYDIAKKVGVPLDKGGKPMPQNKQQARSFASAMARAGRGLGKRGAARILAKYRKMKGIGGRRRRPRQSFRIDPRFLGYEDGPVGEVFADAKIQAYYLTPTPKQQAVGWC